jgi:hypothetical protein
LKVLRRIVSLLLVCVLLPSLTGCSRKKLDEAEYRAFRAHFIERYLETDKASQRATFLPAAQCNRELIRLSRATDRLAEEADAITPPDRWRKHNELLVRSARALAAAMRDFAPVALNKSDMARQAEGSRKVDEAQQALKAAQTLYRELTSGPQGGFE